MVNLGVRAEMQRRLDLMRDGGPGRTQLKYLEGLAGCSTLTTAQADRLSFLQQLRDGEQFLDQTKGGRVIKRGLGLK